MRNDGIFILLVEDNPADVRLTQEALRETGAAHRLHVVMDGDAALDFLRQQSAQEGDVRPDLILLDLNLPGRNGTEVLQVIKADSKLRAIPVVILSTSRAETDIARSYDLHANCYIQKPVDLEQFVNVMGAIEAFWLRCVRLPGSETGLY